MPIITCARTGIAFEAASNRQKNHPLVSELLNEAAGKHAKPGEYAEASRLLAEVKAAGATDIDEAMTTVRAALAEWREQAPGRTRRTVGMILREQKEQRRERERVNAILRSHGYTWRYETEESMDVFGATAFETTFGAHTPEGWLLVDPDGRVTNVERALREIEARHASE
jgi:acyl-CoA reductase-like NAD-dependent aldehyde dehydrogenase